MYFNVTAAVEEDDAGEQVRYTKDEYAYNIETGTFDKISLPESVAYYAVKDNMLYYSEISDIPTMPNPVRSANMETGEDVTFAEDGGTP